MLSPDPPHQELEEGSVRGLLEDERLDVREEGLAGAVPLVVRLLPALQVHRVLVLHARAKLKFDFDSDFANV